MELVVKSITKLPSILFWRYDTASILLWKQANVNKNVQDSRSCNNSVKTSFPKAVDASADNLYTIGYNFDVIVRNLLKL